MPLQEETDKAQRDRANKRRAAIEKIRKRRTRRPGETPFQTAPTRTKRGTRKRYIY